MVLEKIRRVRIEARRLYDPGVAPVLVLFVAIAVISLARQEWNAAAAGIIFAAVTARLLYRSDYRWRAIDEPE